MVEVFAVAEKYPFFSRNCECVSIRVSISKLKKPSGYSTAVQLGQTIYTFPFPCKMGGTWAEGKCYPG